MTTAPFPPGRVGRALLFTWLVTAAWDFLCASALSVFAYGSTVVRLWQGVASVAIGPGALEMGTRGAVAGVAVHLLVALGWSTIFIFAVTRSVALRRMLRRRFTALGVAAVYGPIIWLVMSLVLIPMATGKPPTLSYRWWVQVFAHLPFVTLPLVFTARRALGLDASAQTTDGR